MKTGLKGFPLHCTIHDNSFITFPIFQKAAQPSGFFASVVFRSCLRRARFYKVLCKSAPRAGSNDFSQRQNVASDDDSGMGKGRLERPASPTCQSHDCVLAESVSSGFCLWERL